MAYSRHVHIAYICIIQIVQYTANRLQTNYRLLTDAQCISTPLNCIFSHFSAFWSPRQSAHGQQKTATFNKTIRIMAIKYEFLLEEFWLEINHKTCQWLEIHAHSTLSDIPHMNKHTNTYSHCQSRMNKHTNTYSQCQAYMHKNTKKNIITMSNTCAQKHTKNSHCQAHMNKHTSTYALSGTHEQTHKHIFTMPGTQWHTFTFSHKSIQKTYTFKCQTCTSIYKHTPHLLTNTCTLHTQVN